MMDAFDSNKANEPRSLGISTHYASSPNKPLVCVPFARSSSSTHQGGGTPAPLAALAAAATAAAAADLGGEGDGDGATEAAARDDDGGGVDGAARVARCAVLGGGERMNARRGTGAQTRGTE